jgi:hypothetical protein
MGGSSTSFSTSQPLFTYYAVEVMDGRDISSATRTRDGYHLKNHILTGFDNRTLDSITRTDIQSFVNSLRDGGSAPRTVRDIYGIVRLIMKEAKISELITNLWNLQLNWTIHMLVSSWNGGSEHRVRAAAQRASGSHDPPPQNQSSNYHDRPHIEEDLY